MKVTIIGRLADSNAQLREHIERRLYFALGRFLAAVSRVTVTLRNDRASRGGGEKLCRVHVTLRRADDVIISDRGPEPDHLVNRVCDRLGRAVARSLDRRRAKRRWRRLQQNP